MEQLIITPKTKIYDLLEAYPQLEEVLIGLAPDFSKLRNPVLRNTVAKVASISQAAAIGGLNVEDLVNKLRAAVGQDNIEQIEGAGMKYTTSRPDWFVQERIVKTIDIREMLNRNEQPVHEALSSVKQLKGDEILEIIAPFIPAPLLDKSLSLGYRHWLESRPDGEYRVYFQAAKSR
ncbi:MAG: DUF1858 domain-containing protein [Acidobacteriota bacterium]